MTCSVVFHSAKSAKSIRQGPMEPSEADEFAHRVLELASAFGKRTEK